MNWLIRAFASAVARRIACVLVALALAWVGVGKAHAQATKNCSIEGTNCSAAEASAQCNAYTPTGNANIPGGVTRKECKLEGGPDTGRFSMIYWGKNAAGIETGQYWGGYWYWRNNCSSEPSKVTPFFPPSGSVRCVSNCEVVYRQNADDTTTYSPNGKVCDKKPDCAAQGKNMVWNAMLGVCQPVQPECPQGKVKVGNTCTDEKPCPDGMALVAGSCKKQDNECPAGMIRSPLGSCIPGDGQCAAGEVRGPDGTCKKDQNNDGEPDPEGDKESFAGGDSCEQPPSCSGSPIMCGQARIQWRIDCNTRRNNNISGGHCSQSGMPTCTGEKCNAMEYAGLLMQWRSACAVEKLAAKSGNETGANNADKDGNGVPDALEGVGVVTGPGDGDADVSAAKKWGVGVSTSMIDTGNMFGGGTCPQLPSFSIMGATISGADFPYFCQFAAILRGLILIFAAYWAMRILMGAVF
jgi:hypothetical protein